MYWSQNMALLQRESGAVPVYDTITDFDYSKEYYKVCLSPFLAIVTIANFVYRISISNKLDLVPFSNIHKMNGYCQTTKLQHSRSRKILKNRNESNVEKQLKQVEHMMLNLVVSRRRIEAHYVQLPSIVIIDFDNNTVDIGQPRNLSML